MTDCPTLQLFQFTKTGKKTVFKPCSSGLDPGGGVPGDPEPLPCKSHVPVDGLFFSTADTVGTAPK